MKRIGYVLAVAAALLVFPLMTPLLAGVAGADGGSTPGTITPVVEQGTTDRLGGGDWIVVRAGSTNFGVLYGTQATPNRIYVVADYKRYVAGVDFYDAQGNLIRTKGVQVTTAFAQSLDRMIEFRDADNNSRFDMRLWNGEERTIDVPVKSLDLAKAWTLGGLTQENVSGVLFVNFTVSISDSQYSYVWNQIIRRPVPAQASDGTVDTIAFTFHIRVAVENATARVPWFKVEISGGDERRVVNRTFLGWREFTGQRVNMSVKYDHDIQGWDFKYNNSKLLLETHMMFGNFVPGQLLERYRMRHGDRAMEGDAEEGGRIADDEGTTSPEPREIEVSDHQGTITFADDWYRVGRFTWQSDVTVDGEEKSMYFQVHGGGPFSFEYGRVLFAGVHVLGAFVYPTGDSIFHDPGFEAASYEISIPTVTNLAPMGVLLVQLVLVVVAIGVAIGLSVRRKKGAQELPQS